MTRCMLGLEDGTVFSGESFGAAGTASGEVVFNTAMTGYQEILTDPSYCGQIVTMTAPLIGNYGVNLDDVESNGQHLSGFVVREASRMYSNHRATDALSGFLKAAGVVGLSGVDTRSLTKRLRERGALRGVISTEVLDPAALVSQAQSIPAMTGQNLVRRVMPDGEELWGSGQQSAVSSQHSALSGQRLLVRESRLPLTSAAAAVKGLAPPSAGIPSRETGRAQGPQERIPASSGDERGFSSQRIADATERGQVAGTAAGRSLSVVAVDCGIKRNILKSLVSAGCSVRVVPGSMSAEAILERKPDGILVGNGPGDPAAVEDTVTTLRGLIGRAPIFGICLGHQLLALALGAKTYKLKFGHHGANHPVLNLDTSRVEITSQNHGFAVDEASLQRVGGRPTHKSLYDGSLEGFACEDMRLFAVQYHPEASPGPHDSGYLFDAFVGLMNRR